MRTDVPLPPSWNGKGATRTEIKLLGIATLPESDVVRMQRRFALTGFWLLVGALAVVALDDWRHLGVGPWGALLALPGLVLLLRAWDMRHIRTTRRVLRRLCGQEPD